MIIGYARVSTQDQNLNLQMDALNNAGCDKIYKEKKSGKDTNRPQLNKLFEQLRKGDIVVVWRLDRLGRSLKDLLSLINQLQERGVGFKSLNENIDTTTSTGKLIFHIFASLVEFERELIRERTLAGLQAARARGKKGGRPKGLSKEGLNKAKYAVYLYNQKDKTVKDIAKEVGVSRTTVYNYISYLKENKTL